MLVGEECPLVGLNSPKRNLKKMLSESFHILRRLSGVPRLNLQFPWSPLLVTPAGWIAFLRKVLGGPGFLLGRGLLLFGGFTSGTPVFFCGELSILTRLSLVPAGGVLVDCVVVLLASVRPDRSKAQSLKKSWSVSYNFRVVNQIVVYNIVPMV